MRQLRLVGLAEDGASLVLESPTGESYRLPVDDRVRAACRGDLTRLGQIEIEMDNPLRPREIQMRVRAGESAEQVAASSGMPLDRVLRFASAVLQERGRVVAQARGTAVRPRAADTLGPLVEDRLVSRGTDPATLAWDAWRADEGGWLVRLAWRHGGERDRDHSATWSFDLARRALQPADPAAEQLSAEEFHARTITAVTPLAVAARAADEATTRPRPGGGGGGGAPVGQGGRPPDGARPEEARPDAPRQDAERQDAERQDPGRQDPGRQDPGRQDPGRQDPGRALPVAEETGAPAPTRFDEIRAGGRRDRRADLRSGNVRPVGRPTTRDVPANPRDDARDLSARPRDHRDEPRDHRDARARRDGAGGAEDDDEPRQVAAAGGATIPGMVVNGETRESDEDRARRATVPSWDDILLGVRRRH